MSEIIGNRIKSLRQKRGMTQQELGEILGVHKAAIQKYESGKVGLSVEKIKILCRTFKKYPRHFIYETDAEFTEDIFGSPSKKYRLISDEDLQELLGKMLNHMDDDIISLLDIIYSLNHSGRARLRDHGCLLLKIDDFRVR